MTDFTETQKAFIRQVAYEVVSKALPALIAAHVNSCPWGLKLRRVLTLGVGIGIGTGLVGTGIVSVLGKLL